MYNYLALLVTAFSSVLAQENFLPGQVITKAGDTLSGFIDYRDWDKNPEKVVFKASLSSQAEEYQPEDIQWFSVANNKYISALVEAPIDNVAYRKLSFDASLALENTHLFLQTVIEGFKSLYYHKGNNAKEFFYIKEDGKYSLLTFNQYYQETSGKKVVTENNRYLGQLRLYLGDCLELQSLLSKTRYNRKSLERTFLAYYDCSNTEISFHQPTEKTRIEVGLLIGAAATSLNFKSSNFPALVKAEFTSSISLAGGVSLDIILPKNRGKWIIGNELTYSSFETEGSYNDIRSEQEYSSFYSRFAYSYLKLSNMVRFRLPTKTIPVYINAGISNGLVLEEDSYRRSYRYFFGSETTREEFPLEEIRSYEQGLLLGVGSRLKRYTIDVRVERSNGMSDYSALSSLITRWYLLLGYRF